MPKQSTDVTIDING